MRPTPSEVVDGVARILRETVAPSVADEHARTQLAQVVAVLRSLDAQDARAAVRASDAAVRPLLAACAAWVAHDDERENHFDGLAAIDDGSSDETFAEANDRYESQRATLETFLSSLERWRAEHGAATSDDLLLLIGRHLAAQIAP